MRNGWTYYQFLLFRFLLGGFLVLHFSQLIPYALEVFSNQGAITNASYSPLIYLFPNMLAFFDSPLMIQIFLLLGVISGFGLIFGIKDKWCAFYAFYLLACLLGRNPLITNPSLPYLGWMLILYVFIPKKQGIGWQLPSSLYFAAWVILAISYSYSGYTKLLSPSWVSGETISFVLQNPLARDTWFREWLLSLPSIYLKCLTWGVLWVELLFAPLAMITRLRPYAWFIMLIVQCGFLVCLNFADLTFPMLLIHLLTFDPNWLKSTQQESLRVFYDGQCGLCHRYVKFALSEDQKECIYFTPLQESTFGQQLNTMYVQLQNGLMLSKSDAVIALFQALGGLYNVVAIILRLIPKVIRDLGYDINAKMRLYYFKNPDTLCPMIDAKLKHRFILSEKL